MTVTQQKIKKLKRLLELQEMKAAAEAETAAETPELAPGSAQNGRTEAEAITDIPKPAKSNRHTFLKSNNRTSGFGYESIFMPVLPRVLDVCCPH
jgi:hypothetical protein